MAENPDVTIINDDGSANALAGLRAQVAGRQHRPGTWSTCCRPTPSWPARKGLILEIDHDAMLAAAPDGTPASEDFLPGSIGDCFIPQIVYSTVMTFNTEMFPADAQPATIADFFDDENFPGRRAIQDRPAANLEWALYADGVAIDEIYDVLSTPEGVDRAFAKLDTIKDSLVFWTEGSQPPQLLADKEVVVRDRLQRSHVQRRRGRGPALRDHLGRPDRRMGRLGRARRRQQHRHRHGVSQLRHRQPAAGRSGEVHLLRPGAGELLRSRRRRMPTSGST